MGKLLTKIRKRFNDWNQERQDRKDIEIIYGYPAYCTRYLTLYYNRAKNRWIFEWDDLFADPRPAHWPIQDSMLFVSSNTRATKAEIKRAWRVLEERGLCSPGRA